MSVDAEGAGSWRRERRFGPGEELGLGVPLAHIRTLGSCGGIGSEDAAIPATFMA